jgi:hypothetical protein
MLRGFVTACAFVGLLAATAPPPTPMPTQDAAAEALFAKAKAVWKDRTDVPYLRYGALIRYLHNGHVFDNWWDANVRTSDGQIDLMRLVDADEEHRRLSGIPFSIFGFTIFDTNPDSEPIRLEEPRIEPNTNFGIFNKYGETRGSLEAPLPESERTPYPQQSPSPEASGDLREIGHVEATTRDYLITEVGIEKLRDGSAMHLKLQPLHDPTYLRLRDLWIDPATYRTMQLRVAGILDGEPYDQVTWTVTYVEVSGRNYLQQVVADAPLHFGFDTVIPKFEIDLVDYHFPVDVPKYTFDKPFSL